MSPPLLGWLVVFVFSALPEVEAVLIGIALAKPLLLLWLLIKGPQMPGLSPLLLLCYYKAIAFVFGFLLADPALLPPTDAPAPPPRSPPG